MRTYKRRRVSYKKKAYKKPYRKPMAKKGKRSFAAKVKAVVLKVNEPKETRINWNPQTCKHNGWNVVYHLNQSAIMPPQNLTQTGRVGDNIQAMDFTLRMQIDQFADRPNVNFRYVYFSVPQGKSVNYTDVFVNTTAVVMLDDFNRDNIQVLKTGTFRPNQAGLGFVDGIVRRFTFFKKFLLPHKKLYKFGPAEGATSHNQRDYHFGIVAYDASNSLQTDNLAEIKLFEEFHYRDP